MERPPRHDVEHTYHHVMSRGTNQANIFLDGADRRKFLSLIARMHRDRGIEVIAFCLMGNHFHLVLYCPRGQLSDALRDLKSSYARWFNARHNRSGPVYQDRFRSKLVADDSYFVTVVRYVHRNALDLDPTTNLAQYEWSSHGIYLGLRPCPRWLRVDTARELFGHDYQSIIETAVASDKVQNKRQPLVASPGDATVGSRSKGSATSLAAVKRAVALVAGCEVADVRPRSRNGLLGIAVVVALDVGGLLAEEIADPYGLGSPAAVRMAASRTRRRIETGPEVRDMFERTVLYLAAAS